jgi:hypothetical protein
MMKKTDFLASFTILFSTIFFRIPITVGAIDFCHLLKIRNGFRVQLASYLKGTEVSPQEKQPGPEINQ